MLILMLIIIAAGLVYLDTRRRQARQAEPQPQPVEVGPQPVTGADPLVQVARKIDHELTQGAARYMAACNLRDGKPDRARAWMDRTKEGR